MPRVYLGRLPYRATTRDIEKFLDGYGRIRDISLKYGFAFVEFENMRDAEDAVHDLHGRTMLGDKVIVEIAKGMPRGGDAYRYDRSRSRSRSRGRRRSRSRSKRKSRSRSRDRKHVRRTRSRSRSPHDKKRSRRTRSRTPSPKRSRSRSANSEQKRSASRSRSRSRSVEKANGNPKSRSVSRERSRSASNGGRVSHGSRSPTPLSYGIYQLPPPQDHQTETDEKKD